MELPTHTISTSVVEDEDVYDAIELKVWDQMGGVIGYNSTPYVDEGGDLCINIIWSTGTERRHIRQATDYDRRSLDMLKQLRSVLGLG